MSNILSDEEFEKMLEEIDNEPSSDEPQEEEIEDSGSEEEIEEIEESEEIEEEETEESEETEEEEESVEEESIEEESKEESQDETEEGGSDEEVNEESGLTDAEEARADEMNIDYDEYKKLKEFYSKVTGEFKANGKIVKGFDDPDKLIQAQQMAYGYSKKMAKFNQYKPYLKALQENELLDDSKLNLLIEAYKGKPEAIKQLIENAKLDPQEIDFEEVDSSNYTPDNHLPNKYETELDNLIEISKDLGIDDKVEKELSTNWDTESLTELLENPQIKEDFIKHIEVGVYDAVLDKIESKKALDRFGLYNKKPFIEQYKEAATELEQELLAQLEEQEKQTQVRNEPTEEEIQAEIARIKAEQEYKKKIAQKAKKAESNKRKVATKVRKSKPKRETIDFDPLNMSDEEVEKYLSML